jgi:uncharacterized protein (DUF1499 family)
MRTRLAIIPFLILAASPRLSSYRPERRSSSPVDLGPVSFETLSGGRRRTMACLSAQHLPGRAMTPPGYAVTAADLRTAFAKAISAEPRLTAVASDDAEMTDRYIQRSALMRYPDTIVVKFFDLPEGRSTIALYSRSQLGHGDMGVNRARIERWLAKQPAASPVASRGRKS